MHDESNDQHWLSTRKLLRRYGVSHMWVERRLLNDPDFPKPVKFGRLRFWDINEIEQYERSRVSMKQGVEALPL
jgi:predicted DNA-binding transcriptional regulator AlpA